MGEALRQRNTYETYLLSSKLLPSTSSEIIDQDLHRTYADNSDFENLTPLRNILLAFSIRNPSIGYCQAMNYIAAFILIHFEEEHAFWVLTALIEDILPVDFYANQLEGMVAEQMVMVQ